MSVWSISGELFDLGGDFGLFGDNFPLLCGFGVPCGRLLLYGLMFN